MSRPDLSLAAFAETGEPSDPIVRAVARVIDQFGNALADELAIAMTEQLAQARKAGFDEGFRRGLHARERGARGPRSWRDDARR